MGDADKYPWLELVFDEEGDQIFLLGQSFELNRGSGVTHKLMENPSKAKYLRSLCILMLLAKYHGGNRKKPNEDIPFIAETDEFTWLRTLGTAFSPAVRETFFFLKFDGLEFITAKIG